MTITDFSIGGSDGVQPAAGCEDALARIRLALADHARTGRADALQGGLDAATELVAALAVDDIEDVADVSRLRRLAETCPEFGALLDVAVGAAADALAEATGRLWAALGLRGRAPEWDGAERQAARMVFACACATPSPAGTGGWLADGLRRVAAARIAGRLCDELGDGEAVWLRVLGDRYGSLRHRCAPRTVLRSRGLSELMGCDEATRAAVTRAVERWVSGGAWIDALAVELEAAVVHARTPARLA